MIFRTVISFIILMMTSFSCSSSADTKAKHTNAPKGAAMPSMQIKSDAFAHQGEIPSRYTCKGTDLSPPLTFVDIPPEAKSLVLIVDDPDAPDPKAPKMTWVHWVLYNLPPTAEGLEEAVKQLPKGTLEGINDWKRTGWGGPCPPIGRHRYFFKLFALSTVLPDLKSPTKAALLKAMDGKIIAQAEMVGTYQK